MAKKDSKNAEFDRAIHDIINPEFMSMTKKELDEFDQMISKLQAQAARDFIKSKARKNDAYTRDDIFQEAEEGGESHED